MSGAPALGVRANPGKGLRGQLRPRPPVGRGDDPGKGRGVWARGRQPRSQFQGPGSSGRARRPLQARLLFSPSPLFPPPSPLFREPYELQAAHTPSLPPSLTHARAGSHTPPFSFGLACPVYLEARMWNPSGGPLPKTQDFGATGSWAVRLGSASIPAGRGRREGEGGKDPRHTHTYTRSKPHLCGAQRPLSALPAEVGFPGRPPPAETRGGGEGEAPLPGERWRGKSRESGARRGGGGGRQPTWTCALFGAGALSPAPAW